jgi:type II secretory pathway component PulF
MLFGWGNLRLRVNRAVAVMEHGGSLPDAIRASRGLFGRPEELLARVGLESGRLAEGLRLAVEQRRSRRLLRSAFLNKFLYIWTILLLLAIAAIAMAIVFAPRILRICADFDADPPRMLSLINAYASRWFDSPGPNPQPGLFAQLLNIPIGFFGVHALLLIFLLGFLVLLLASLDLRWSIVPGLDRIFRQQERSLFLRSLALGIEGKRPLAGLLAAMVQWHHRSWIRSRLVRAYGGIAAGQSWCEALRSSGLVRRPEADLLSAAERAGNLPWALRELADSGDRRFLNRVRTWTQLLYTAAMLAIGALILLFALAYFPPLILLIERTAEL